ncbi:MULTISPECIES: ribonuclease E/G [unclassified Sphingomonas]|uniref:Rne/Rng family ribonuclease n=1 Tax=Sphingomonas TaxID=13687 RepID=UPI00095E8447|nr:MULTISPECIES: ribonuclease E/G [unclassified Sphingomonas]MBN8810449.1 Rne/Rng family ribonuclease [Sphingomonas sp.]OJY50978.1 MAG: ribonuclease E/G [Sphingomonas sp. 67-41]
MTMRMLIDARHREETRVAVVKGSRIEEFDFESAERKQLKGNIYLAKVTRVEPSLQAAFVDYGGNRHGFLAFSEIHPDYYQIPKEDREALLREEAEHAAEEAALRAEEDGDEDHDHDHDEGGVEVLERPHDDEEGEDEADAEAGEEAREGGRSRKRRGKGGGEDSPAEALRQRRMNLRRRYKIQDVIRRRQVLLVQVVKEERGNKGAALTTYLSLAGRYCVLMPNTAHGGGISRKISSAADRKRLKGIMADLKLPPTMGCIVRTAGLQRTKVEIKRDFDYLARLWDGIRENTLKSTAPALVYGDSDLLKRAIRDIYNRDIDEVIVEGEDGYRQAKDFMKLLMPSHAKKVKQYADAVPLFQRAGVEDQLSAMYNPVVQLKSGGYLVINPTEALVSIDINSGRSTREHNIEQTATATNLEAAHEIARQLRLRDMAGLVVIDFIDMDHSSNVRKVEKAMKEALKNDRARIQVGRISAFGLMEMSRQRLRTGVLEASTVQCPHCEGTGLVRTASSAGLSALRLIEDEAARGRGSLITLRASQEAAFYVLNKKRADIAEIEDRYGVTVEILSDGELEGARMSVEASGPPPAHAPRFEKLVEEPEDEDYVEELDEEEEELEAEAEGDRRGERDEGEGRGKRRRRRRGRGRGRREEQGEGAEGETEGEGEAEAGDAGEGEDGEEAPVAEGEARHDGRKRRRRGRRGGRRGDRVENGEEAGDDAAEAPVSDVAEVAEAAPEPAAEEAPAKPKRTRRKKAEAVEAEGAPAVEAPVAPTPEPVAEEAPAKPKHTRRKKAEAVEAEAAPAVEAPVAPTPEPVAEEAPAKPKRTRRKKAEAVEVETAPAIEVPVAQDTAPVEAGEGEEGDNEDGTPRRGWWQRTFGA